MPPKIKPLPLYILGWKVVYDFGMVEISSINKVSGNKQRKRIVTLECPNCGDKKDYHLGSLMSKPRKKLRCISDICKIGGLGGRYAGMVARCYDPKAKSFNTHGAIGIKVCSEWLDDRDNFIQWAKANGYKPELFLDRKDNSKYYSPGNCRWVTPSESCLNRNTFKNNTTGYRGISRYKNPKSSKHRFQIRVGSKQHGRLQAYADTIEEAIIIRSKFIKQLNLEEYYI